MNRTARLRSFAVSGLVALAGALALSGCAARVGRLSLAPGPIGVPGATAPPLLPDAMRVFQPGTADPARRYLGRLEGGSKSDTVDFLLCGDNRPSYRSSRFRVQRDAIHGMISPNPLH